MSVPAPHPASGEVPGYLLVNSVVPGTAHRRSAGQLDVPRSTVLDAPPGGGAGTMAGAAFAAPAHGPAAAIVSAAAIRITVAPTRPRALTGANSRPAAPPPPVRRAARNPTATRRPARSRRPSSRLPEKAQL